MPADLGAVEAIPSKIFVSDDKERIELYSVVLSMSMFFNNLRDIFIIYQLVKSELKGIEQTNNPAYGQHSGMIIFVDKLFDAYLYEFLKLVEKNNDLFESEHFNNFVFVKLPKEAKVRWKKLLVLVKTKGKVFQVLEKLRNNLGFHYYQPKKLYQGYFDNINLEELYLSFGPTVSHTRYYFSDRSCQSAKKRIIEENSLTLNEWNDNIQEVLNLVLMSCMNIVYTAITSLCAPSVAKKKDIPPL